ncbi:MAG: ABC transporter ATP-binding protein [Firmicutes bacterium]|nr:ABC transporter ATP-binding protein [Bacillota bacterium]
MAIVRLGKISRIYHEGERDQVQALRDISIELETGSMCAITGPSGSGKSTLLHILAGLDRPTSGNYYYQNQLMNRLKDREICRLRNTEIAVIMQDYGLLSYDTVQGNVMLPAVIGKRDSRETLAVAKDILNQLGIGELSEKKVSELSGGERQRVAVARSLLMNAKLILADEPTGALDTVSTDKLMDLFESVNQQGITIVIVTHDPQVAKRCPQQFRLVDGRIV